MRRCWNCGKKSQAIYCNEACRSSYFLWLLNKAGKKYPPQENVETRCRTCGGFRAIQADIEGVSMAVRCPECQMPENVEEPT